MDGVDKYPPSVVDENKLVLNERIPGILYIIERTGANLQHENWVLLLLAVARPDSNLLMLSSSLIS